MCGACQQSAGVNRDEMCKKELHTFVTVYIRRKQNTPSFSQQIVIQVYQVKQIVISTEYVLQYSGVLEFYITLHLYMPVQVLPKLLYSITDSHSRRRHLKHSTCTM